MCQLLTLYKVASILGRSALAIKADEQLEGEVDATSARQQKFSASSGADGEMEGRRSWGSDEVGTRSSGEIKVMGYFCHPILSIIPAEDNKNMSKMI